MNNDLWIYIRQLYDALQNQKKKIENLEQQLEELKREITEIKTKPKVHIEKIEYKFDQLKVESLEGTLTIGLTPGELEQIGELQIDNHHLSPKVQMERSMMIEDRLFEYVDTELPAIVMEQAKMNNITITDDHVNAIMDDFKKQIPQRIAHYFTQLNGENTPHATDIIIDQTKKDMIEGVRIYLNQLKEKG